MRFVVINIQFNNFGENKSSYKSHGNFFTKETGEEFEKQIIEYVQGVKLHPFEDPKIFSRSRKDVDIVDSYYIDTETNTKNNFNCYEFYLRSHKQKCYFCGGEHRGIDMVGVRTRGCPTSNTIWFCKKCVNIERIKPNDEIVK